MSFDLACLPHPLIESALSKMDYLAFTTMRGTSRGIGEFIDRKRRQFPVYRDVAALLFSKEGTFIRTTLIERPFLQDPETILTELPFLRPEAVGFSSIETSDAMKFVQAVKTRGVELIVNDISESAVIYLSSILRPKLLSSDNIEYSADILFQPGFQDLETISIKSPQEFIDLSPCALKTEELIVDMSYAPCPERDIVRLLKMWERGEGKLTRMELKFDEEFENIDLCTEIIETCAAEPLFIREIHDVGPFSWLGIDMFKNPRYDRLMIMSSRSPSPQVAVILFQRGKFIFEGTALLDEFFDTLNILGNAIFADDFRIDFRNLISVLRR